MAREDEGLLIDGVDYLGKPTGRKVMVCPYQFEKCEFHVSHGEGAIFVCGDDSCVESGKCLRVKNKICTTFDQSQKLIGLGVDKETADMHYWMDTYIAYPFRESQHQEEAIPLWSLSALLELMPGVIEFDEYTEISLRLSHYKFRTNQYDIKYIDEQTDRVFVTKSGTPIDAAFEMMCWLLENGHIKTKKEE